MKPLETTVEEVLRKAIQSEVETRSYYQKMAERAGSVEVRTQAVEKVGVACVRLAYPPEIDALRDIEQAFVESSATDATEMARLNRAFHEAICRAARNRYLDNASRELQDWIALLGPTTFTVTGRPSTSHGEHQAIIEAIAARDGDRAEQLARAHIREALRCRLKLLQKQ